MKRQITIALICAAVAAAVTGCASTAAEVAPAAGAAQVDRTAEIQASAGAAVISATEVEPGRIDVATNITDPRGDAGSGEALAAIAICESVATSTGATHVKVFESDGTTFVALGGSFAVCTEV